MAEFFCNLNEVLNTPNFVELTNIAMPNLMLSTSEKYYPHTDKFILERWIKSDPQYNAKTHPFVRLPFNFGPRMYIGRRFAELKTETLVTKVS
jgi:cytochrome P450